MTTNLDHLIASAKLTGRIDELVKLRDWLNERIADAERANEQLKYPEAWKKGEDKGKR